MSAVRALHTILAIEADAALRTNVADEEKEENTFLQYSHQQTDLLGINNIKDEYILDWVRLVYGSGKERRPKIFTYTIRQVNYLNVLILEINIFLWMSAPNQRYSINDSNFMNAAKQIQFGNLRPSFLENIVKQELQKNKLNYAYPATIANAKIHRDAYKFGYSQSRRGEPPRVCPCCQERVETEEMGMCYRTSNVKAEEQIGYNEFKLRPGIALFFSFIKMLIVYLLFRFVILDAFNLLTNIIGGSHCMDAGQTDCSYTYWNVVSLYNKKNNTNFIFIQDILSLALVVLSIVFFFLYRKRQYHKAKILNQRNQVEEDYTLLVEDIPLIDFPSKSQAKMMRVNQNQGQIMELFHRQHLWKFFQSKVKHWLSRHQSWAGSAGNNELDLKNLMNINNGELRSQQIVKSISLCYNLQRLETLQKQKQQLIQNRKIYQKLRQEVQSRPNQSSLGIREVESDNRFASIANQVQFLNDCEIVLNKQYASDNSVLFNITNFVGKALISFQYQHYREYIIEEADRDINFLIFNGSRLKVSRVSNPRDIYWQNLRHSKQKQRKKLFSTIAILFLLVAVCLGLLSAVQFGVKTAENALAVDSTQILAKIGFYSLIGFSVVVIMGINKLILIVARQKTKQQYRYSKSSESKSIIFKSVIFQFICSAILPYAVSRIFNTNFGSNNGLILQIIILISVSGFVMNGVSLLFPKSILRAILLKCKYGNKKPEDTVDKFQIQLNKQFQYVEFDIVSQYVSFLNLVLTAFFYSYLIPVTIPILVIVLFFQFWIDKLNLFKRCSHPRNFSFFLTRNILKTFEASIWVFALGVWLFGIYIHGHFVNIFNLVGLGIATLYLWFLMGASRKLQRSLFGSYESSERALYDDCVAEGKFEETYWTSNPATCLVRQSDITGRQHMLNPGLNKIFVSHRRGPQ